MRRLFVLYLSLTFVVSAAAFSQGKPYEDGYSFVFEKQGAVRSEAYRTTIIPLVPDRVCFGWAMRLFNRTAAVQVKETLSVEEAPAEWRHGEATKVAQDRKTGVTTDILTPIDGWIQRSWCILPGDPTGAYIFDIEINGKPAGKFIMCAEVPGTQACPRYEASLRRHGGLGGDKIT